MKHQTKCWSCKVVLTNTKGERPHGAIFDSEVQYPRRYQVRTMGKTVVTLWALCEECYPRLRAQQGLRSL
jgi:hypothetical protein